MANAKYKYNTSNTKSTDGNIRENKNINIILSKKNMTADTNTG